MTTPEDDAPAAPAPAIAGRTIGPHLPLGQGLLRAADRARQIGATAVQVFTDNPTAWRRRREPPSALAEFRRRLRDAGIGPLAIHAPYLVNLAGANEDFRQRSIATMTNELRVGASFGARFVVMHIGSHRGLSREEGIARLAAGLRSVIEQGVALAGDEAPLLVLENAAGSGDGIGARLEDLADILEAAAAAGADGQRLGVCLDTAHLWGAGYDLGDEADVDGLVRRADVLFGERRLVMLHLNDSRTVRGSRLDRHEHIAAGELGSRALRHVLAHPRLAALPTYLETPGMDSGYDAVNLERVRMLLAGEEPPELPADAFAVRGARSRSGPPGSR